jgi:hypothetical protein
MELQLTEMFEGSRRSSGKWLPYTAQPSRLIRTDPSCPQTFEIFISRELHATQGISVNCPSAILRIYVEYYFIAG